MAQVLRQSRKILQLSRSSPCLATSPFRQKSEVAKREELSVSQITGIPCRKSLVEQPTRKDVIPIVEDKSLAPHIAGIPEEELKDRRVRIYKQPKYVTQSGTDDVGVWRMDWDTKPRWENSLIGWTSTADPLSNTYVQFHSEEAAIAFAEKQGWQWQLDAGPTVKPRSKSYGFNFSWDKRSRVSTK